MTEDPGGRRPRRWFPSEPTRPLDGPEWNQMTIGRQQPVTQPVSGGHIDGSTPYWPHAV